FLETRRRSRVLGRNSARGRSAALGRSTLVATGYGDAPRLRRRRRSRFLLPADARSRALSLPGLRARAAARRDALARIRAVRRAFARVRALALLRLHSLSAVRRSARPRPRRGHALQPHRTDNDRGRDDRRRHLYLLAPRP